MEGYEVTNSGNDIFNIKQTLGEFEVKAQLLVNLKATDLC